MRCRPGPSAEPVPIAVHRYALHRVRDTCAVVKSRMNLHAPARTRIAEPPVTVGLIGAGKFGTMFLSQARLTRGLHVVAVADLNVERARSQLATAGWPAEQFAAVVARRRDEDARHPRHRRRGRR